MAHHFKIKVRPHRNKDGTESKTKKDYVVLDRTRRGTVEVGVAPSIKAAEEMIAVERQRLIGEHVKNHPNDEVFRRQLYAKGKK